jgi:hypothetical protein
MPRGARNPSDVFQNVLALAKREIFLGVSKASSFEHKGIRGDERAGALSNFLRERLPEKFGVGKGEAIDYRGRGVDIVTVQQLLGHSTVTVTMRYTHTNLDAKRNATQKLESFGDNLVTPCTKMQQSSSKTSLKIPLNADGSYNWKRRSG